MKTKIFLPLIILVSFLVFSYNFSYANTINDVKTKISQLKATDTNLPSGVSEPKGIIGTILTYIFDTSGKIKSDFLNYLWSQSGNNITYTSGNVSVGSGKLSVDNSNGYGSVADFFGDNHSSGDSATRVTIKDNTANVYWFLSANNDGSFAIHSGGDRLHIASNGNITVGNIKASCIGNCF